MTHSRQTVPVKNNLKEVLKKKKITPRELHKGIGEVVGMQQVYKWIQNRRQPGREHVRAILLVLRCKVNDVFYFDI